ncbi:MAG: sulfotransferase [Bacteroidetes bacterium]|nr:sulfotransferase [Bacteroidota bacterium]
MRSAYLTAGIRLKPLFRLLRKYHFNISFRYLPRFLFILQNAIWASLFYQIEKKKYPSSVYNTIPVRSPIFIIGHWRTGSTYLHQLLNLDANLTTPTLFQVALPDSFLVSYRYYKPIMNRLIRGHRPMDDVTIGMNEPQEDEYALLRSSPYSPLERLVFPEKEAFFLQPETSFLPTTETDLDQWKKSIQSLFQRITLLTGKRIVTKNPLHSMRIPVLKEMFPDALFIHIYRNPYDVVASTRHLWQIVATQNRLHTGLIEPSIHDLTTIYRLMMHEIDIQWNANGGKNFFSIRFEDLEKDPVSSMKLLYSQCEMDFHEELERKIKQFQSENQGFSKNVFTLTAEERMVISQSLEEYFIRYGYEK